MSYLEHTGEDCGCPTCDLTTKYLKDFDAYKLKPAYRTIEFDNSVNLEKELNEAHVNGYELIMNAGGTIILRSMPPEPPNVRDILNEINRRKEETCKDTTDITWADDIIGEMN